MTFRHKDTDEFEGPLIAVYVEAAYKKSSGKFVYELSQSKDEEEVNALDEFFEDGDVVEYESCSLFIDSVNSVLRCTYFNRYCDDKCSDPSPDLVSRCFYCCSN